MNLARFSPALKLGLRTIVIATLLFAAYYIFLVLPRVRLPNALTEAEHIVAQQRSALLRNRTVTVALGKAMLRDDAPFAHQGQLLVGTQAAHDQLLETVDEPVVLRGITGPGGEALTFYLSLEEQIAALQRRTMELAQAHHSAIGTLTIHNKPLAALAAYDPTSDLGLSLPGEASELSERAQVTEESLRRFANESNGQLQVQALAAGEETQALIEAIEREDWTTAIRTQKDSISKILEVKNVAKEQAAQTFRSSDMVRVLTDEANHLQAYDALLAEIRRHRFNLVQ